MQSSDLLGALRTFLAADATVAGLVSSRVFVAELPRQTLDNPKAPLKSLVVRAAGGVELHQQPELQTQRFDVVCYGETQAEADKVRRAAYGALRRLTRETHSNVLIHWVQSVTGMQHLRDPDTEWPSNFQTFQALASEFEV